MNQPLFEKLIARTDPHPAKALKVPVHRGNIAVQVLGHISRRQAAAKVKFKNAHSFLV